jgi:hypothetical protein
MNLTTGEKVASYNSALLQEIVFNVNEKYEKK